MGLYNHLASMMVLPNKLPIILSDQIEALSLKMPEPQVTNTKYTLNVKNVSTVVKFQYYRVFCAFMS